MYTERRRFAGYINEHGFLNVARFAQFMQQLAAFDRHKFEGAMEDEEWLARKRQPRPEVAIREDDSSNSKDDDDADPVRAAYNTSHCTLCAT